MPAFGSYTTVREIHRTGLGCVFAAAKTGAESEVVYAVKTCRPDGMVLTPEQVGREIAAFVIASEYARKIGENPGCSRGWAKVYAVGRPGDRGGEEDGGAYCVTDLATIATAEKVIAGRVPLDGPTLAWLVGGVVESLRDLEEHLKRGHGNLKPSNVLICGDREKELRAARVLLSDPSPHAEANPEKTRLEDLRSIGALIHALVLHARFQGGWPVEPSARWTALGRDGGKWRDLVNTLLDPNPRAERPTLDELAARLKPLAVAKRSRTPLLVGMAAALLLAGGATLAVYHYTHREVITIVKWNEQPQLRAQNWRDLCAAYRGWYSLFQDGLGKPPTMGLRERGFATRREAYIATDPQLKELLALPGIAEGTDPWSIAHVARDTELSPLANAPTDYARSDIGVDKTEQALASVEAIKKGLVEGWKAPQRLKEKAASYRQQGWIRPAMVLENAAANVNPDKAPDPSIAVDSVLGLVPIVEKVDASWEQIQKSLAAIGSVNDPVLAKFAGAAAGIVGAGVSDGSTASLPDLLTLEKQATTAADLATQLATFAQKEWPAIDVESFTTSPKYAALAGASPSAGVYADWLAEVRRHPSLDPALDPRRAFNAGELLAGLDQAAAKLTGKPLKGVLEPSVGARLTKLHADVPAMAPDKLFWKRSNEQRVKDEAARVKGELDAVKVAIDGLIEKRRAEFAAAAADVRQRLTARNEVAPGSAAINGAWRMWRDAMVKGFKDEDYEEIAAKGKTLEEALGQLGKTFPPPLAKSGEGVPATDWAEALAEASGGEREKRLGAVLSGMGAEPPDPTAEAFTGATTNAAKDFAAWTAKLTQMRTELGKAEEAMNSGLESSGPESIEAIVSKWTGDAIGKQPEIAQAIAGIRERVEATRALKAEKSAAVLVGKVMTPDAAKPELTLAAWRRLGDADVGWPSTQEQLDQGKRLKVQLAGVIAKLPEARRGALAKQVSGDLTARWTRYAAGIREPRALEAALAAMPDYSVDEGTLPPKLRYNVLYAKLRAQTKPDDSDERVVEVLGAFDRTVRGLGAEVTGARNVGKLLADAAPIVRAEEIVRPKVDPKTLGPGQMGGKWQATLDTTTADLTFTRGSTTLLFVRVEVPGPDPEAAVYLCTRELSIGDAAEIVDSAGASGWAKFKDGLPQLNTWKTPRGWTLDARGVLTTQGWMQMDSNMTAELPGYAPGILQPGQIAKVTDAVGGEPQRDHPLQEIPPFTLAYVARLAGCRFPTSAEWIAAHKKFDGGAVPAGSNLRDATFEKQKQYIKTARESVTRQDGFPWPDTGAFTPAGGAKVPVGEKAASRPENDGVLWFVPTSVGGGDRVHHLVGNVAELVVEDGPQFEQTPASTATNALQDMLGNVKLEVIGGSALSAPELPLDRPILLDFEDITEGYSDIGCRLAFNAAGTAPPRESFAVRLRKLLTDDGYLLQ
jgi:hypothetical protein